MGFFNRVRDLAGQVGLGDVLSRVENKDEAEAAVAAMAFLVSADGEVSKDERKGVGSYIGGADVFQAFDRTKLANSFESYVDQASNDLLRDNVLNPVRKLRGNTDGAQRILKVCTALAGKDGSFDESEKVAVRELAQAMGVSAPAGV